MKMEANRLRLKFHGQKIMIKKMFSSMRWRKVFIDGFIYATFIQIFKIAGLKVAFMVFSILMLDRIKNFEIIQNQRSE